MRKRRVDERGASAVELGLWLPVLVFLVLASVSAVGLLVDYSRSTNLSARTARFATRSALDPLRPGDARTRPTAAEIDAYARTISGVEIVSVTVTPDPSVSLPGTEITVTITTRSGLGPLADMANGIAAVLHQSPLFTGGGVDLTSVATMREE